MRHSSKLVPLIVLLPILAFAAPSFGRELSIAMSASIPPYVIREGDRGIYLDVLQEALKLKGHSIGTFHYVTNKRMVALFNAGKVDAILNAPPTLSEGFPSDAITHFENVVVSLANNGIELNTIPDLKDLRMIAFQNAHSYMGDEFHDMTVQNDRYSESTLQINQVRHLFLERTDIILLDRRIFEYYRQLLRDNMNVSAPVKIHRLFPKVPRNAVFLDSTITDQFNDGLRQLKASGRLDKIYTQYLN